MDVWGRCKKTRQGANGGQRDGREGTEDSECTWPTQRSDERAEEPLAHAANVPCLHSPSSSPHLGAAIPAGFAPERCEPAALGGRPAHTCSWPRMMTPWGLMACQEARFSPAPRCSPSWYADHLPSRVVHATQMWCQALSFRLSGSWATFVRRARARHLVGLPGDPGVPPAPWRASSTPQRWRHPKFYRHLDALLLPLKTSPGEPSSPSSSLSPLPWALSFQFPHPSTPRSIISQEC